MTGNKFLLTGDSSSFITIHQPADSTTNHLTLEMLQVLQTETSETSFHRTYLAIQPHQNDLWTGQEERPGVWSMTVAFVLTFLSHFCGFLCMVLKWEMSWCFVLWWFLHIFLDSQKCGIWTTTVCWGVNPTFLSSLSFCPCVKHHKCKHLQSQSLTFCVGKYRTILPFICRGIKIYFERRLFVGMHIRNIISEKDLALKWGTDLMACGKTIKTNISLYILIFYP